MSSLFDLTGKVALVTGTSTGLGAGMAIGLARAGADLVLAGPSDSSTTAATIRSFGRNASIVQADISTMDGVNTIIAEGIKAFGRVDILVNNAGIIRRGPALEFSEQDWDDVTMINSKALFFLAQGIARDMMPRKTGKIINVASLLSFQGGINVVSYAASKGAVAQTTKALSNEWAKHGINVNAIAPGYMETNNTEKLRTDPVRMQQISERIPAGRWGKPQDLEGAVVFLASAASDYVHGQVLAVDGGWLAR